MVTIILQFALGLCIGYAVGSFVESFMHEYVSDALPKFVRAWQRSPRLCKLLIDTHFSHHTIHHVKTYRLNHVTQFRSEEERLILIRLLRARGNHGNTVIRGAFATKLHGQGAVVFVAPLLILFPFFMFAMPTATFVGSAITLLLPAFMSHFVHPYIHQPFSMGQSAAPKWLAWFLRSRYGMAVYRNHFMHHRYGGTSNFNLVLGADYVRRKLRTPSQKDTTVMILIGMPLRKNRKGSFTHVC